MTAEKGSRDPPEHVRALDRRIDNIADAAERPRRRVQRVVANTVIGQMMPAGVVRGGTAIKLRVGDAGSRFTPDFDVSRPRGTEFDDYLDDFQGRLSAGWSGFTGRLIAQEGATPDGVPDLYIMKPFDIKLEYRGKPWLTARFELGHGEIDSSTVRELRIAQDIIQLFASLRLDEPAPVPVLALEHQIAQKLHACTAANAKTGGNMRAHDLVDLQILEQDEAIDLARVGSICRRLFLARRAHAWPPLVKAYEDWATLYAEAAEGLAVRPTVEEAVVWANEFIARAVGASESGAEIE